MCQAIAGALGWSERMEELEQLTDLNLIRLGREEIAGWYAGAEPSQLSAFQSGTVLAPGAREAFGWLRQNDVEAAILSVTWEFAVEWFARILGADSFVGTRLNRDGTIDHVWPEDKARTLEKLMLDRGLDRAEVAAVGDSWGDIPMLRVSGHPVFVGPAAPPIPGLWHAPGLNLLAVAKRLVPAAAR